MHTGHNHRWKETIHEKIYFMNTHELHVEPAPYSARNQHRPIRFFCAAPNAKSVALVGDFNQWQPFPMQRTVDGWWHVQIELTHGHHRYRFLVDGTPTLDPHATGMVRDENNERASLVAVS